MIDVDLKQQLGWLVIYILILSCLILLFIALFIFMIVEIPHLHTIWEALSINMLESISFFLSASLLTITVLIYSLRSTACKMLRWQMHIGSPVKVTWLIELDTRI